MDERIKILAKNLVNYSCDVQKKEKVLIHCIGTSAFDLVCCLVKEVYDAGGLPFVEIEEPSIMRELQIQCTDEQLDFQNEVEMLRMKGMDAYIAVRASDNLSELSDVPSEQQKRYLKKTNIVVKERVNNTKWVVLRYPNNAMAQVAAMSRSNFEDFYFNVCNLDYAVMARALEVLRILMNKTDKVRITGPGTDLCFSIKDIPAVPCCGLRNIPDGEIFTAPVKDSVNGKLSYNAPSIYQGTTFENVCLEFESGKIINATANHTDKINKIFDTDEGARYIGEFSIAVNPYIIDPMKDTLFDEKIMGSFHFTPGACYEDAPNGNESSVHWDLVCIQTEEYGGGEIYFDDVLIRKNGIFVLEELKCLNPENLK